MDGPGPSGDGTGNSLSEPCVILYPPHLVKLQWGNIVRKIGIGLLNQGNTCYMNSVLQCLTHTAPLANYCMSDEHLKSCTQKKFCLMCEFAHHTRNALQKGGTAIRPIWINQNAKENIIAKSFREGRQEDAHEFLRVMVDGLQKACLNGYTKLDRLSRETTVVNQIFGGYLQSQVRCTKCSARFNTYDPYMDISLDIKDVKYLEEAFARYVKPETLDMDNAYKCEKCQQKVRAQKRLTIYKASNVLTIQLKRFDYMNGAAKIRRHIGFNDRLNIRPYMSQNQGEPVCYHLYGVLIHSGADSSCGHYYCYVKSPSSVWYLMNDGTVQSVPHHHVFREEAYVLFYLRDVSKLQNNQAQSKASFFGPVNKGWNNVRLNGMGNKHGKHGPNSSHMNGVVGKHPVNGNASNHAVNGVSVNGTSRTRSSCNDSVNGNAGNHVVHGSSLNGTAHHTPHRAPHSRGNDRLSNSSSVKDSGDCDSLSQQTISPLQASQSPASSSTSAALPQHRKKISFDFNHKAFQGVRGQVPQPAERKDSVNSLPAKRIVMHIKNGKVTTVEKSPNGEESVVKCSQTTRAPSVLVPYEDDSDSCDCDHVKASSSANTALSQQDQDMSNEACSSFSKNSSVFTGTSAPATENRENGHLEENRTVKSHVEKAQEVYSITPENGLMFKSDRENISERKQSLNIDSRTNSIVLPVNKSECPTSTPCFPSSTNGMDKDCVESKLNVETSNGLGFSEHYNKSSTDQFSVDKREIRARAGSLDKTSSGNVKHFKRSSSLEPIPKNTSLNNRNTLDCMTGFQKTDNPVYVLNSVRNSATPVSNMKHDNVKERETQQTESSDYRDTSILKFSLSSSGENIHRKRKKKKRKKNKYRYSDSSIKLDYYGHRYNKKKHRDDQGYWDNDYKDKWQRQREYRIKRHSDTVYTDYDCQSSRKRRKSDSSESEYVWEERTKETLMMEKSAAAEQTKEHSARHVDWNGEWRHADMNCDRGERHSNSYNWNGQHENHIWKKVDTAQRRMEDSQWAPKHRYPTHSIPSRERWREDYHVQPHYPSQPYTSCPVPPPSRSYADHNSYQRSSNGHFRDHQNHKNGFNGSQFYTSHQNYSYQRHY